MYICLKCGEVFDEPDIEKEYPVPEFPEYEEWTVCPWCGGDYEEAVKCLICDEWHKESECEDGVCKECIKNTMKHFYALILDTFDDNERMVIAENIDLNLI